MKIEELQLSVRSYNALKRAGIETVEQLRRKTTLDLYKIRNLGETSIKEIRSKLAYTPSIADRIRAMSDEELCDAFFQLIYAVDAATWFCKCSEECGKMLDAEEEIPDEKCKACLLEKLRSPVTAIKPATMADEEKKHSGLIEEE